MELKIEREREREKERERERKRERENERENKTFKSVSSDIHNQSNLVTTIRADN